MPAQLSLPLQILHGTYPLLSGNKWHNFWLCSSSIFLKMSGCLTDVCWFQARCLLVYCLSQDQQPVQGGSGVLKAFGEFWSGILEYYISRALWSSCWFSFLFMCFRGRYDMRRTPAENINLPPALLSRFDLMWLILDRADMDSDLAMARHVLHVHQHSAPPSLDFTPLDSTTLRYFFQLYFQSTYYHHLHLAVYHCDDLFNKSWSFCLFFLFIFCFCFLLSFYSPLWLPLTCFLQSHSITPICRCLVAFFYVIPYLACGHPVPCMSVFHSFDFSILETLCIVSLVILLWLSAITSHNHPVNSVFHIAVLEHIAIMMKSLNEGLSWLELAILNYLSPPGLRAYVASARQVTPFVPHDLTEYMASAYSALRQEEAQSDAPHSYTTARTLLSIIRLSEVCEGISFNSFKEMLNCIKFHLFKQKDCKDFRNWMDLCLQFVSTHFEDTYIVLF